MAFLHTKKPNKIKVLLYNNKQSITDKKGQITCGIL